MEAKIAKLSQLCRRHEKDRLCSYFLLSDSGPGHPRIQNQSATTITFPAVIFCGGKDKKTSLLIKVLMDYP